MDARRVAQLARELDDDELAGQLAAARREVVQAVDEPTAIRHLLAMREELDARHGAAPTPPSPAASATVVSLGERGPSGASVRTADQRSRSHGVRSAVAAAAAVLVLTVGLASTNTLPTFAQQFVADVGGLVGLDVPRPTSPESGTSSGVLTEPGDATPPGTGVEPRETVGDIGSTDAHDTEASESDPTRPPTERGPDADPKAPPESSRRGEVPGDDVRTIPERPEPGPTADPVPAPHGDPVVGDDDGDEPVEPPSPRHDPSPPEHVEQIPPDTADAGAGIADPAPPATSSPPPDPQPQSESRPEPAARDRRADPPGGAGRSAVDGTE